MTDIVYILLSIAGILFIPIILLFVWWLFLICKKIYEGMITTMVKTLRVHRLKFLHETRKYKDDIAKLTQEVEEEKLLQKEEKRNLSKIVWDRIVLWTHNHYIATAFIASFVVAILFMITTLCVKGYVTDNERVVLSFVGILATFVVLTNHAQSVERIRLLEKMLENTKKELNETIEQQRNDNRKQLQSQINDVTTLHMSRTFNFIRACQDQDSYKLATAIFNDIKNRTNKTYIVITKGKEEYSANIAISKSLISFASTKDNFPTIPNKNIQTVDGLVYDYEKMSTIVFILKQLDDKENNNNQYKS